MLTKKAINEYVIPSYRRLGEFLRDEYLKHGRNTSGVGALRNGKEFYLHCVRYWTTTQLSPDEIYAIGETEVARIRAEMEQTKREMGFAGDLQAFFEYLRTIRPSSRLKRQTRSFNFLLQFKGS